MVVVAALRGDAQQVVGADEAGLPFLTKTIALAANVQHVALMQQPVYDRRGDDGVAGKPAPFAEALGGCEDDATPFPSTGSGQA